MKDLIILILVALVFFFVWNSRQTKSTYSVEDVDRVAPVPPLIIQAIIEKFQSMKPDFAPIDTVFVNIQPDGSYLSRIMFYNTKHFFGTQYDIKAKVSDDGSVSILDIGDSSTVDPSYGYKPDQYQTWVDVQKNLDAQFSGALQGYKNQTPQPNLIHPSEGYAQGMLETDMNLMTRS
jgi:hypothetical protein